VRRRWSSWPSLVGAIRESRRQSGKGYPSKARKVSSVLMCLCVCGWGVGGGWGVVVGERGGTYAKAGKKKSAWSCECAVVPHSCSAHEVRVHLHEASPREQRSLSLCWARHGHAVLVVRLVGTTMEVPCLDLEFLTALPPSAVTARNRLGCSMVHLLAAAGYARGLRLWLTRDPDVNARDHKGNTPLHSLLAVACSSSRASIQLSAISEAPQLPEEEEAVAEFLIVRDILAGLSPSDPGCA
jgi:hypothetical protein